MRADAENLPSDDRAYDIAVMKEALHHPPRPYIALHAMFRVAREGIVVIEPHYRHPSCAPIGLMWKQQIPDDFGAALKLAQFRVLPLMKP